MVITGITSPELASGIFMLLHVVYDSIQSMTEFTTKPLHQIKHLSVNEIWSPDITRLRVPILTGQKSQDDTINTTQPTVSSCPEHSTIIWN